jgi:hypothetical protein
MARTKDKALLALLVKTVGTERRNVATLNLAATFRRQDTLRKKRKQWQVVCCTDQQYVQMARSSAAERQTTARAAGQDCWD